MAQARRDVMIRFLVTPAERRALFLRARLEGKPLGQLLRDLLYALGVFTPANRARRKGAAT